MSNENQQTYGEPPRKRKNFRIPTDLADWAEQYAKRKNTTLTQVIIDYLTYLRELESKGQL